MDLEVGFLPENCIRDIPDAGGYFPFSIDGKALYVIDYQSIDEEFENFLCDWMKKLDRFPIYAVFEYMDYQEEEIEKEFSLAKVERLHINFKKEVFIKTKLTNLSQLQVVMPYLYGQGSMNFFAAWSLSQDLFSFDKREMNTLFGLKKVQLPVISLKQKGTVFWVDYDGQSMISISNEKLFSSIESISHSFPSNTHVIKCE
ncbi:hypothetical protein ACH0BF_01560 [Pseudobacillus sp. 179-B 2D1 NHS]|uniref:hypothetical protein n=1 Tax=Pseudobacillus sp. 179-B 2D1 NHS TaxID=3374292 RepID=UPI003879527E